MAKLHDDQPALVASTRLLVYSLLTAVVSLTAPSGIGLSFALAPRVRAAESLRDMTAQQVQPNRRSATQRLLWSLR